MPRFAANLSTMYQEHAFVDRFAAAAADGFTAVEYLFPYDDSAAALRRRLDEHGLEQVLFNAPPGDWAAGERGLAAIPGRERELRAGVDRAIEYAVALGCPRFHLMAGALPASVLGDPAALAEHWAAYERNVGWAAQRAAAAGVGILVEPINPRDLPGYLITHQQQAHELVQRIGAPNLQVQLDLYHCQIVEGDVTTRLREGIASGRVGHVQIASVPGRHEPDEGELAYPHVFAELDAAGYAGWVGCEYRPRAATSAGLGWFAAYRGVGAVRSAREEG